MSDINEKLKVLAKDLTKDYPSGPRRLIGGYVLAARTLDKCRAVLAGTAGEYHFNCPLDRMFFDFSQIDAAAFKSIVASGATDDEVSVWVAQNAKPSRQDIIRWNNQMRDKRISDLPIELQEYMEDYIPKFIPRNRVVYHFFDVYDIEEQRL
ncbi:MAG: DUF5069 domain-containing protein [Verrucomicrobiota bacterium]|nr:DUF5069 domain-containing protein [Verrucomicrobiota bacterium]